MQGPIIVLFFPAAVPKSKSRYAPPYALLHLERMLRDTKLEVVLLEEDFSPDYGKILEDLMPNIFMVCVSAMTGRQIEGGIRFSKYIKEKNRDIPVVWGGWHSTVLPMETLREDYIDYVVAGQGEMPFKNLVNVLINKESVSEIKGLGYKIGGELIVNPPDIFYDISAFPDINYDLIDLEKYVVGDTFVYFASHGCIYNCGFCTMAEMYAKKWYPKPVEKVIKDLIYLKEKAGFKRLIFQDDNFFVNKTFTLNLCAALIQSGLELEYEVSAHSKDILKNFDDADMSLIYASGCRKVFIGAESGCPETLKLINKKETVENHVKAMQKLAKHNIITVFSTMVALPLHPARDIRMTIDMLCRAKIENPALELLIFYYTPFPKTPLYPLALQNGFVPPASLQDWADYTMFGKMPWHTKSMKRKLEVFYNYYFPFYNKDIYKRAPLSFQKTARLFYRLFGKSIRWRFNKRFFGLPVDALLLLFLLKRYNKKNKDRFCFSGTWSFYENRYF